ncbi:hypothetical protein GCM10025857_01460 [Alicyclobacillus contaminans]|nr:hypothetical protein GCM10025857_01460 [Alicyclobacillus contaminans]
MNLAHGPNQQGANQHENHSQWEYHEDAVAEMQKYIGEKHPHPRSGHPGDERLGQRLSLPLFRRPGIV